MIIILRWNGQQYQGNIKTRQNGGIVSAKWNRKKRGNFDRIPSYFAIFLQNKPVKTCLFCIFV